MKKKNFSEISDATKQHLQNLDKIAAKPITAKEVEQYVKGFNEDNKKDEKDEQKTKP